jgi:hypothetical protein
MYRLYHKFFSKLIKLFGKCVIVLTDDKKTIQITYPNDSSQVL